MSALFDPLFGTTAIDAATDDRAWLTALCEAETALARACSQVGLFDLATALEIGAAADALKSLDPAELGREAVADGDLVEPLVRRLRAEVGARAGEAAAAAVQRGASNQDVLDTAAMLVSSRALGVMYGDLRDCADHAAAFARTYRDTVMNALADSAPTTFGAIGAGWGTALDRHSARLAALRDALPIQLGGFGGTFAGWYPHGFEVRAAFADELDLREPSSGWHADRGVVVDLATALGGTAAALARIATDILRLMEAGELQERPATSTPGAAGSVCAAAEQAPGLVATVLASGLFGARRGAGSGQHEWPAMTRLLRSVGGASSRLRDCLLDLTVDAGAMRAHVDVPEPDTGHAVDVVDRYLNGRRG